MFDQVIADRKKHYVENPKEIPERKDADAIISKWANTNAVIAGAAGLVPGPWGMLAALPEIITVIRNQTKMIFDLCLALGQHKHMRSELVIGILMSSVGAGGGSLIAVQGGKLLVKRASLRVMQKIIAMLGGKVTQQLLKSMVGKWLPIVGAAAMAAWARYTTKKLGEQAVELLDEAETTVQASPEVSASPSARAAIEVAKIRALTNVMLADQEVAAAELEYLRPLVESSELSAAERERLGAAVSQRRALEVDYSVFRNAPDDAAGLLISMVALARRDGNVHLAERLYIKQVARLLGFSDGDVNAALEADMPRASAAPTPVAVPWRIQGTVPDPQFRVPVPLAVAGSATVLGAWGEAIPWIADQAGRIALDGLARSSTSIALAWSQSADLARSIQETLDTLLRPHQMHVLSVERVEVQVSPEGMAALERVAR
jgi:uncharacterized tellurite resistance protein B-like protein